MDNQRQQTPQNNTPFYTFDDNSTTKPNDNTIIRNPTLMFRFGQDKNVNRSHHINPVNLSKLEFNVHEDAESNYASAYDQTPQLFNKQSIKIKKPEQIEYTTKEISDFCLKVSVLTNDLMNQESDLKVCDIANNISEGKQYELLPNLFSVSNSFKLPNVIKREITDQTHRRDSYLDYGFLEGTSAAYFSFEKTLFIWPFPESRPDYLHRPNLEQTPSRFQFEQMVTSVAIATPLPGMDLKQSDKILIVATITEVKIFYFIQSQRDAKIELVDSKFSVPTDSNVISKIVQVKKNGRIFYGGSTGNVIELKYQDASKFDIISLLQGEKRKLKKNDMQSENIMKKLLPSFLKFNDRKTLVDIKLDEQRNVIYSVCMSIEQGSLDETVVEVFDLGILSNKFNKIATIRQSQVVEMIFEFWQRDRTLRKGELQQLSSEYKIIHVTPINVCESSVWHLLLVTQNGYRIFIQFDIEECPEPSNEDLQLSSSNTDFIFPHRFTRKWKIIEIMHFPEQSIFIDTAANNQPSGVFTGGPVQTAAQGILLDGQSILYDSLTGILSYVQSSGEANPADSDRIIMNLIKRNESTLAYMKQVAETGSKFQNYKLFECYSQLHIPLEKVIIRSQTPVQQREEFYEYLTENVIELQFKKNVASQEIKKLIGLNKCYIDSKGFGASPIYEQLCLSEFEKQVYLLPNQMNILTDNRVIEVQQLRPIDMLVMVVHSMIDQRMIQHQYDNFEEFLDLYSFRETCGMLLQIIVDRDGYYLSSQRVEESLNSIKKRDQFQSQPRQLISKSSQLMRRGSQLNEQTGYIPRNEIVDQLKFRKSASDARQIALQLFRKYGDCVSSMRTHFDIQDDELEGMPISIQNFSCNYKYINQQIVKHVSLYLYYQRVVRPLWDIKLAYKLPHSQDKFYRPTFESLNVPRKKLEDLIDFINMNESILYGETFSPNVKANEKFVRNPQLLNAMLPVHMLKNNDKQKLEIMERNSLKNLKFAIIRSIQAIDMLSILTFDNDQKMFNAVQKQINDKDVINQFADMTFKDLITIDSNLIIRRFLEASVQIESANADEAHVAMRQKYAHINKVCSTFFSKQENISFIGINLLQAASKEKNMTKKEDLLKQSIENLCAQPLNIDLNQVPQLLIENGNYTSLADLTLRKIRALEQLNVEQRQRVMSDIEYQQQLEQCYSIILQLYAAIDLSVSKESATILLENAQDNDYRQYFLTKLSQVQNDQLKISLKDKILKRIQSFDNQIVLMALLDYVISKPNPNFSIDTLPNVSESNLNKLFDEALKSEVIKKTKFDSIFKLLMKRNDAERLCLLVINICCDSYKLMSLQGNQISLSLQDKQKMIYTALNLIDDVRNKLPSEVVFNNEQNLNTLNDNIISQLTVLDNVNEAIQGLSQNTKAQIEGSFDQRKLIKLQTLQKNLQLTIISQDQLIKECIENQLSDAYIQLHLTKVDIPKIKQEIIAQMDILIDFYQLYFPAVWFDKITVKINYFLGKKTLLKEFLLKIQTSLENKYKLEIEDELLQLIRGGSLMGTRFALFEYCMNNLIIEFPPSEIYQMFAPIVNDSSLDSSMRRQDLNDLTTSMSLFKLWVQKHNSLFNNPNFQQQQTRLGLRTETEVFIQDLRSKGQQIFNRDFVPLKEHFQREDVVMNLDKQKEELILNNLSQIHRDFESMLEFHNVSRPKQAPALPTNLRIAQKSFIRQPEQSSFEASSIHQSSFGQEEERKASEINKSLMLSGSKAPAFSNLSFSNPVISTSKQPVIWKNESMSESESE